MSRAVEIGFFLSKRSLIDCKTCAANSLVGVNIKALFFGFLIRWVIKGIEKAIVFPVPVCAVPRISWPFKAKGIACAWIGVAESNFNLFNDK